MAPRKKKRPESPALRCRAKRQTKLFRYFDRLPAPPRTAPRAPIVRVPDLPGLVIALWDHSHTALAPWKALGFECMYYFPDNLDQMEAFDLYEPVFACAFPDSTDLSIAGARWFKQKREKNPRFQEEAAARFADTEAVFRRWECPYFIEGPAVGLLWRLWRRPDATYNPCDYGGYLPAGDDHPRYPHVIPRRDAYCRASGLWVGGGYRQPGRRSVEPEWRYYYSVRKAERRRMNPVVFARGADGRAARACPPRGFCRAVCERLTSTTV